MEQPHKLKIFLKHWLKTSFVLGAGVGPVAYSVPGTMLSVLHLELPGHVVLVTTSCPGLLFSCLDLILPLLHFIPRCLDSTQRSPSASLIPAVPCVTHHDYNGLLGTVPPLDRCFLWTRIMLHTASCLPHVQGIQHMRQELADCDPWVRSSPWPLFEWLLS
jgi:hypothetical protein